QALLLLEGRQRDCGTGVPEPDVGEGCGVVGHGRGGQCGLALERQRLHVVEVVGGTGGGDVPLDVRLLQGALGRVDLQGLEDGGVDDADDEGDEGPDADGEHREGPALASDVVEEDGRGEQGDEEQDLQGWQSGVDVGVAGPPDVAVGGRVEGEPGQDVPAGLDQGDEGQQDRQVDLHRRSDPWGRPLGPDAAVQVVEDGGDHQHDHQGHQSPIDEELEEREPEDEEADVHAELRVLHPEGGGVGEEDPVVPLPDRPGGGDEGQDEGDGGVDPAGVRPDDLLVPADQLVIGLEGGGADADAVADQQVHPQADEEEGAERGEEADLDGQQGGPDAVEVDRREPEAVGVEGGQ